MKKFTCEDLYCKASFKQFLRRFDLRPNKTLGQHFLIERSFHEAISRKLKAGGYVVDVGAGPGNLSCLLKERFNRIYSIEIDSNFKHAFKTVNPEPYVKFVNENFLDLDFDTLQLNGSKKGQVAGNIPYSLTAKILEKVISNRNYVSQAIITIQKEVAERIQAEPGTSDCGPITYFVRAYGEVQHITDIPKSAFFPPPDVESSIIKILFKERKNIQSSEEAFHSLVRGVFLHRRKTIRKGLIVSPEFSFTKEEVDRLLGKADIDKKRRPEELSLEEFDRLAEVFDQLTNSDD